jgi:protocatechuate 3,4-dioxygenase beta subunit
MNRWLRHSATLLFLLAFTGQFVAVTCQSRSTTKTPPGSISGRITVNGKGVGGMSVGARPSNSFSPSVISTKAITDADGNYRINDLGAGSYDITPISPAYVESTAATPGTRIRSKTVLLSAGENVTGIDFSLARGGVITGKVTDADGRPVIEERIQVIREDEANRRGQAGPPSVAGGFQTDDRGIYRVYGVPPGRYRVAVGQDGDNGFPGPRMGHVTYKRTYYPDASDVTNAQLVEITEGSEASNIDIVVGRTLPGFVAAGRVIEGETGQPVPGLRIGLRGMAGQGAGGVGYGSTSNSQGEFRFENVTPGKYAVVLLAAQQGMEVRADPVPFDLVDQNVSGLVMKTVAGQSITGVVVIENATADKNVYTKLATQRLSVNVRGGNRFGGMGRGTNVNPDGTFRIGGLAPGSATFYLVSEDRQHAPAFNILRVEREGVSQPKGIEIKSGENVAGIKIFVAYGNATVRGQVKFENGEPPENSRSYVWLKQVGENGATLRPVAIIDARGHFLFESVPAGNYELNVNTNLPGRRGKVTKQLINVTEGTATDVEVTVDLKPPPDTPNP